MLTPDQKRLIAEEASHATRMAWGDIHPQQLGQLVANITSRAAQGTLSTPTFADYADALVRQAHTERVFRRDAALDALLDHEPQVRKALTQIEASHGPDGVAIFASAHGIDLAECARILEEEGRHLPELDIDGPELGD